MAGAEAALADLMLMPLFARRWQDAGLTIDAVHPGVIRTRPGGPLGVVLRTVKLGWQPPPATDTDLAHRLWWQAADLTGCDAD